MVRPADLETLSPEKRLELLEIYSRGALNGHRLQHHTARALGEARTVRGHLNRQLTQAQALRLATVATNLENQAARAAPALRRPGLPD